MNGWLTITLYKKGKQQEQDSVGTEKCKAGLGGNAGSPFASPPSSDINTQTNCFYTVENEKKTEGADGTKYTCIFKSE